MTLRRLVRRQTRTGRDEPAHDDVLLDAAEIVRLAADGRLGEHLGRLLEATRREMNDSVESDALVMPSSIGSAMAGLPPRSITRCVLALEDVLLDLLVDQEVGVADVLDAHAAQHLPHDDLDVLVVDGDALQAVNLLDFVHEPSRELLLALHAKDVVRVRGAVLQRLAGADAVARLHLDVLALGDQVLARLIGERRAVGAERRDDDLALALRVLAEATPRRRSRDDRVILRLAGLEELGDARQTAGDVLHLRGVARDLRDDLAGVDRVAVLDDDVGADREQVARVERRCSGSLTVSPVSGSLMRDARAEIRGARLDDDLAREAGDLVDLLHHRDAFDDVAELRRCRRPR